MPLPAAVAIPPAAGAFCAGAAAASKSLALRAAPYCFDVTTLSYTALAAWLLRYFWKHKVPEWAKEDVSFRALLPRKQSTTKSKSNNEHGIATEEEQQNQNASLSASEREEREMANLSSVLEKLQALINSVQLDDDHPSILQQYAALLAYIQLSAQVKRQEQERMQQGNGDTINHNSESNSSMMEKKEEEEKKENKGDTTLIWESRDSLYENAKPPSATIVPPDSSEYDNFAQNPNESPLFQTLQQTLTFATWAYYDDSEQLAEKLAALDFELLLHSKSNKPGHAAYYLAVSSKTQKQLVIGVRGTSTLEDIVTDCCGRAVPMDDRPYYYDHDRGSKLNKLNNDFDPSRVEVKAATAMQVVHMQNGEIVLEDPSETTTSTTRASLSSSAEILDVIKGQESIWVEHCTDDSGGCEQDDDGDHHQQHMLRCHEGIMMSAKRLVDRVQEHIEDWVVKRGYQLVLCGHSLGAGCASLAAVLLRSRLPELQETHNNTASSPAKMRVYCFAPPPVLDRDAALAATSYCTSIVNNADMIPRCSLENLLILLEILRGVWGQLQHQGLAPTGPKSTAAFFRKIAKGSTDEHMLLTTHDLRLLMYKAMRRIKDNQSGGDVKENNEVDGPGQTEWNENCCCTCEASSEGARSTTNADDNDTELKVEKIPNNPVPLYIPGVVLLAYEPWRGADPDPSLKEELLATTEAEVAESDYEEIRGEQMRPFLWKVTDGTTNALHFLEMEARMGMDHATTSYYSLLDMEYEF